jgi:Bacterial Ig-like domain (group 3)/Chitobiase/beta-hexosaminidase C-terminal domain
VTGRDSKREFAQRQDGRLRRVCCIAAALACAALHAQTGGVITTVVGPSLAGSQVSGDSLSLPTSVTVTGGGLNAVIYTADTNNCVVWETQNGQTTIFAGELGKCGGGTAGSSPTTTSFAYPVGVAQCNGDFFIATHGVDPVLPQFSGQTEMAGALYEVTSSGSVSTLPLSGLSASGAGPVHPVAVACDSSGNAYVSLYAYAAELDFYGMVEEDSPGAGGTWTNSVPVNGDFDQAYTSIAVSPVNGNLYGFLVGSVGEGWLGTPNLTYGGIENITTSTSAVTGSNSFESPAALIVNSAGNFFVSYAPSTYEASTLVELVEPNGSTTLIAGTGTAGDSGDGGVATQAEVNGVDGMAIDSSGYLYLADAGNQRVRRIHLLESGPSALNLVSASVSQSSNSLMGSQQAAFNPDTGDFYYVAGTNTVNVVNSGSGVISPGYERIIASIPVGAASTGSASTLTLVLDSLRDQVYVNNTADGKLYVINGSTHTLAGSVALSNAGANVMAFDPGLDEVYVAGQNAANISAVQGGATPKLIGNASAPFIISMSVDTTSHVVYGAADTGAGTGQEEALFTMTPNAQTGVLSVSSQVFPSNESIFAPDFITNSIASDPQTGSLIAAGVASLDTEFVQSQYDAYDIFQFTPDVIEAPVPLTWPPLTTSLDVPNRVFYLTDFDGVVTDPASEATMVTGMDGVISGSTLTSTTIPVYYGDGGTPPSPHVFDVEPDTAAYQAWMSASDTTDGGFVRIWDSSSRAITWTAKIPNLGGGHLFVDSNDHAGYLLDHVNGLLWLLNTPQWTATPPPVLSQAAGALTATIQAAKTGDAVYYTIDGTPPALTSTVCNSPCTVNLTAGIFTTINAIEVETVGSTQYASNVAQGDFTAAAPTSVALAIQPSPTTTGASTTATLTITPAAGVISVTGSVTFTSTFGGSQTTLCSQAAVVNNSGDWQATCTFKLTATGSYTIGASYSGDELNDANSTSTSLTVNQGSTPVLGTVSGTGTPIAINSNNAAGLTYNAVLYNDSSLALVQNGALIAGQTCPAYAALTSGASGGSVFIDAANNRIYLAMLAGGGLYVTYESINPTSGACTQGPLLELSTIPNQSVALDADIAQGNVYVMNWSGADIDALYVLPTGPWSASSLPTPAKLNLDYSVQYGPMIIDPSNHQLYINDLGTDAFGSSGTYATSGFFVYSPNQSATPANNLEHVVGYVSGATTTPFNASALLDNGAGKLVLVNANPTSATTKLTTPLTILDTTQFSFFSNTQAGSTLNTVDITPGSGLSTISATSSYNAIGAADINAPANLVYTYAFNQANAAGLLLEYNIAPAASPVETVLSSSLAAPVLYDYEGPWTRMNYNPESTEIVFAASAAGSGALALTSPLCAGPPSLTQVVGNEGNSTPLDLPVVNTDSGYVYAIQLQGFGFPATSPALLYVAPPPSACSAPSLITPSVAVVMTSPTTFATGASASLTVAVSGGTGNPTPTGSVALSGDGYGPISMTLSGGSTSFTIPPWSLPANASVTLTAAYTPDSNSASTYNSASGNSPALTVDTVAPTVTVQPASLSITTAQTLNVTVTVSAGTGSPTAAGTVTLTSGSYSSGAVNLTAGSAPITIPAGSLAVGSDTLTAGYAPGGSSTSFYAVATGASSSPVVVTSSTAPPPPANISDTESITVTDSEVVSAYTLPAAIGVGAPVAYYSVGSPLGFGGVTGDQQIVAVSNVGQAAMTLASAAVSSGAPFTLSAFACFNGAAASGTTAATLPSGGFCTLTITYTGTSPSTDTGTLTFTDNAALSNLPTSVSGANDTQTIMLNGEGTSTPPPAVPPATVSVPSSSPDNEQITVTDTEVVSAYTLPPAINVSAPVAYYSVGSPLGFGGVTGSQQIVAVSNAGEASMTLSSAAVSSGAPFTLSAFACFNGATASGTTAATLPSGGFCTLTITYTGTAPSTDTGSLVFTDNAALSNLATMVSGTNDTQSITLNGQGTSTPPPALPPPSIPVPPNGDTETITVTDTVKVTAGYIIGGTVTGLLPGTSVTLLDNGSDTAVVSSNGAFTFPTILATGATYGVTVSANPANETCTVANATGTVATANVSSVAVNCKIGTTTTLAISPTPASNGLPVTFTATVAPVAGTGTPTGSVTFACPSFGSGLSVSSGPIPLVSGVAVWTTTSLVPDQYNSCFTATYSGDPSYLASASAAESLTVTDFVVDFSAPANLVLLPGQSKTLTFTVAPADGTYSGTISFAITGLPSTVTATFNPSTVTLGTTPVTVTVTLTAAQLTALQQSPPRSGSATPIALALILPLLGPLVGIWRARRRVRRAGWLVVLAILSLGALLGVSSCGGSGFFNQPPQTYSVVLTATSGTAQHSTTFNLTVE